MVGQATAFAPNYNKALLAAARVFKLLDRKPKIDANDATGLRIVWIYYDLKLLLPFAIGSNLSLFSPKEWYSREHNVQPGRVSLSHPEGSACPSWVEFGGASWPNHCLGGPFWLWEVHVHSTVAKVLRPSQRSSRKLNWICWFQIYCDMTCHSKGHLNRVPELHWSCSWIITN